MTRVADVLKDDRYMNYGYNNDMVSYQPVRLVPSESFPFPGKHALQRSLNAHPSLSCKFCRQCFLYRKRHCNQAPYQLLFNVLSITRVIRNHFDSKSQQLAMLHPLTHRPQIKNAISEWKTGCFVPIPLEDQVDDYEAWLAILTGLDVDEYHGPYIRAAQSQIVRVGL